MSILRKKNGMKNKLLYIIVSVVGVSSALCIHASANSSWRWVSETRPYDILPFIIALTLIAETLAYVFIAKIKRPVKVFAVVAIANHLSFLAPYILGYIGYTGGLTYTFDFALEHLPYYTIGIEYFLTTILVEFPVIWFSLKNDVLENKIVRFVLTIVGVNAATTLICAAAERAVAYGVW